jgi:hypothetical protein
MDPERTGFPAPAPVPARSERKIRDVTPYATLDVARLTPSAPVAAPEAAEAVRACFGLTGELVRLPGEADDNFLLHAAGGQRYVVKFAHPRADPAVVSVQVRVLRHVEAVAPALPVPRVRPAADGQPWAVVADGPLRGRVVHVLSYLDGRLLRSVSTDQPLRRTLGATLAELGRGAARLRRPAGAPAAAVGPGPAAAAAAAPVAGSGPGRRAAEPARGGPAAAAGRAADPAGA